MAAVVDIPPSREPDNQALQAALELSMVNINNSNLTDVDLTFNYSWDGYDVNSKSLNVTQCVSVPSSEHVAEIVGKQGVFIVYNCVESTSFALKGAIADGYSLVACLTADLLQICLSDVFSCMGIGVFVLLSSF